MQITLPNEILIEEVASILEGGCDVELMTKGTSMLPFIIGERDSVILKKVPGESLRPGDVVLARRNQGNYVLHRIVLLNGDKVTLRGDGNLVGTEKVAVADVLGKVTAIVEPSGMKRSPGKASLWRNLPPFARRCVLALYRRTVYRILSR